MTEATPLAPSSSSFDYHRAEVPWYRTQRYNDLPVIVTRTAWVLSPASLLVTFYRGFVQREEALPLVGAGDNWMSFVHVEDCAGLLLHAARHALPGSAVNVFTGEPLRQAELAQRLAGITHLPVRAISSVEAERRFGRAARQAFESSARMSTLHTALYAEFQVEHRDVVGDLAKLLRE